MLTPTSCEVIVFNSRWLASVLKSFVLHCVVPLNLFSYPSQIISRCYWAQGLYLCQMGGCQPHANQHCEKQFVLSLIFLYEFCSNACGPHIHGFHLLYFCTQFFSPSVVSSCICKFKHAWHDLIHFMFLHITCISSKSVLCKLIHVKKIFLFVSESETGASIFLCLVFTFMLLYSFHWIWAGMLWI